MMKMMANFDRSASHQMVCVRERMSRFHQQLQTAAQMKWILNTHIIKSHSLRLKS